MHRQWPWENYTQNYSDGADGRLQSLRAGASVWDNEKGDEMKLDTKKMQKIRTEILDFLESYIKKPDDALKIIAALTDVCVTEQDNVQKYFDLIDDVRIVMEAYRKEIEIDENCSTGIN